MYKHNAVSIKESDDKQFVSSEDKQRWDNKINADHNHDSLINTKQECDDLLDSTVLSVDGTLIESRSKKGFMQEIEIFGKTIQPSSVKTIKPTLINGNISTTTGEWYEQNTAFNTDFIAVTSGDILRYTNNDSGRAINLFLYDKNKQFIKYLWYSENDTPVIQYPCNFVRISHNQNASENTSLQITHNDVQNIQSVGDLRDDGTYEIDLVTCGGNKFDITKYYNKIKHVNGVYLTDDNGIKFSCDDNAPVGNQIKNIHLLSSDDFVPNKQYTVKYNHHHQGDLKMKLFISYTDGSSTVCNNEETTTAVGKTVNYISTTWSTQLNGGYSIFNNICIYEKGTLDNYEEYKEITKKIIIPCQLEKVGDYADKLFIDSNGKVIIEKHIFTRDASTITSWGINNNFADDDSVSFYYIEPKAKEVREILCNKAKYSRWYTDPSSFKHEECYGGNSRDPLDTNTMRLAPFIRLYKSRLSTYDTNGLKQWIAKNGLLFKLPLMEPEIIEVGNLNGLLIETLEDRSIIYGNSTVRPRIKGKIPNSIQAVACNNSETIENIHNTVKNISNNVSVVSSLNTNTEFGNISLKDTCDGYTNNIVINGKTVVNLAPDYTIEWKCNGTYLSTFLVAPSSPLISQVTNINSNIMPKPSTVYTIIVNVAINTSSNVCNINNCDRNANNAIFLDHMEIPAGKTGVYVFKAKSIDDFNTLTPTGPIILRSQSMGAGSGEILINKIMVLEGDYNDLPINYISGVSSVGDNGHLLIESYNENLFDKDLYNRGNAYCEFLDDNSVRVYSKIEGNAWFKYFKLNLEANTEYRVSMDTPITANGSKHRLIVRYGQNGKDLYDSVGTLADLTEANGKLSRVFKTYNHTNKNNVEVILSLYAHGGNDSIVGDTTYRNIKIEKIGYDGNKYNTSKKYTKKIHLSQPLRSLPNGVCDTIEKINGTYVVVRRCGSAKVNGNEQTIGVYGHEEFNKHPDYAGFVCQNIISNVKYYTTGLEQRGYSNIGTVESISALLLCTKPFSITAHASGHLYFSIKRSSLSTVSVDGFRSWLRSNNLDVVYELASPVIEDLGINCDLRLYDNVTHVSVLKNNIVPHISVNFGGNLANTVYRLIEKVNSIENTQTSLNTFLLRSVYEADKTSYRLGINTKNQMTNFNDSDSDIYNLINIIIKFKQHKNIDIESMIDFYTMISKLTIENASDLFDKIYAEDEYIH